MSDDVAPPREPEIDVLARVARAGLLVARGVLFAAGVAALLCGLGALIDPERFALLPPPAAADGASVPGRTPIAMHFVWFCPGILFVAPTAWTFGRGRWPLLAISVLLWFVPAALPGDHRYGFVLRMFGSLVAFLSLLVWRTLWRLAVPAGR